MKRGPRGIDVPEPGDALLAGVHRFGHEAMGTIFEVLIAGQDAEYARQAAAAAFEELDRLHNELTRFDPASDVSQVNRLGAGEAVRVGLATLECLRTAARVSADTGGAFDVTVGRLIALWKNPDGSPRSPTDAEIAEARARTGMALLDLCEDAFAVGVRTDGVRIDLGGIGKGYAVDVLTALLRDDWGVRAALVHGGRSTLFGFGSLPAGGGWPLSLSGGRRGAESLGLVRLSGRALSGSASPGPKPHILDPRCGRPATGNLAAWSLAPSGALADALSTAFLVLAPAGVEQYCGQHPAVSGMLLVPEGEGHRVLRFGPWEGFEPRP